MAHYGRAALETFAHLLAAKTDHRVDVRIGGAHAYNCRGNVVVLPDRGVWDEEGFRALCGVAVHEVAHVTYESLTALDRLLSEYAEGERPLARDCFNVIIDVADETRIVKVFPGAEALLAASSDLSLRAATDAGTIPERPPLRPTSWQILAAGIWLVRSKPGTQPRRALRGWRTRVPGLGDVVHILARAKDRSRPTETTVPRSPALWRRLLGLARELVVLMKRLGLDAEPESRPAAGDPAAADPAAGEAQDPGDPMGRWFRAARERLERQGEDAQASGVAADRDDWQHAIEGPGSDPDWRLGDENDDEDGWDLGSLIAQLDGGPSPRYDEACYRQIFPAFRQTARTLPIGRSTTFEEGHQSGGRLSRPHRAAIDGKCFRRSREEEAAEGAVALLFDHSGSMRDSLGVFLPVGVALADALEGVGFEVATWRYGTEVERLDRPHDLERPRIMGGTRTDLALGEARRWLEVGQARRKLVVVFTDGEPDDRDATRAEAARLRRRGVELLFGTLGMGRGRCEALVAELAHWASVFDIDPANAASSLQVALRRIARRA